MFLHAVTAWVFSDDYWEEVQCSQVLGCSQKKVPRRKLTMTNASTYLASEATAKVMSVNNLGRSGDSVTHSSEDNNSETMTFDWTKARPEL